MELRNEARDLHYYGRSLDVAKPGYACDLLVRGLTLFLFVTQLLTPRLQHD